MHRIAVVVAVIAVVLAGCAAAQTEAEKKREAFRLSHVPQTHRSRYLKANALIKDGDHYLREGMAALEQKNKFTAYFGPIIHTGVLRGAGTAPEAACPYRPCVAPEV
jgi:hypothetical protein